MRPFIVTGTDTGVGKTLVSALLLARLKASRRAVRGFKPIATGNREDARWLQQALGVGAASLDTINPVWYEAPVAPMLAARLSGHPLFLDEMLEELLPLIDEPVESVTVIEGAGGWLSPLGEDFSTRELAEGLEGNLVVVAANRLGVINSARLTIESILASHLTCAGIILSHTTAEEDVSVSVNASLLCSFFPTLPIWTLPFMGTQLQPEKVHELAAQHSVLLDDIVRGLLDRAGIGNKVIVQR